MRISRSSRLCVKIYKFIKKEEKNTKLLYNIKIETHSRIPRFFCCSPENCNAYRENRKREREIQCSRASFVRLFVVQAGRVTRDVVLAAVKRKIIPSFWLWNVRVSLNCRWGRRCVSFPPRGSPPTIRIRIAKGGGKLVSRNDARACRSLLIFAPVNASGPESGGFRVATC